MLSTRFQNQINYIVVVSYIGRGNRKTSDLLQVKTKTYSICIWNLKYNFLKKILSN
jgi:hypothetical protein